MDMTDIYLHFKAAEEGEEGGLSGEAGLSQHCEKIVALLLMKIQKDSKVHPMPISSDLSVFFF